MLWTDLENFAAGNDFPPPARRTKPESAGEPGSEAHRPRILVIDDEHLVADTVVKILNISGFEARAAYDGQTALDLMKQSQPEYVLTDVVMPRLNGVDLAIAVRKLWPAVKIFLFSGQAGTDDV